METYIVYVTSKESHVVSQYEVSAETPEAAANKVLETIPYDVAEVHCDTESWII